MSLPPASPNLIRAAARGDAAAWTDLLDGWLPVVLGWCRRLGGASVDAEDVAHDVFVTVMSDLADLRDPVAFPRWLFRVTTTTLRGHRRAVARRTPADVDVERTAAPVRPTSDPHRERRVLAVLDELPDAQREVLVLCLLDELPREEVAELLELPVGTVKSRLRLAVARFRGLAREAGLLDDAHEEAG